ncbi:MAG: ankyrin repeat domain-containing protein [Paraglaciecola sp.]|uniref:ankyrin repeat domain-containing protein n=1 Tax=Paraglaciecola sp. TaxID=1920173 RepID=UPI00329939DD
MKYTTRSIALIGTVLACPLLFAATYTAQQGEPLVEAIKQANHANIKQVFNQGFDVNDEIRGDGTPLIIAARNGDLNLTEHLIDIGADVNQISLGNGNPLIAAVQGKNITVVERILQQGVNIDANVENDETALINASHMGNLEMVRYLVEQGGADINLAVNAKTSNGVVLRSPLNMAKTPEVKNYLITRGATL